jgi:hypothetical protein
MISVVMTTLNSERDLIEALSPLVPASIEGLVQELVVFDGGSSDATLAILDEAGAVMVGGGLEAAAARAKGPWLLVMPATGRLSFEWIGPVRRHLEAGQGARHLVRGGFLAKAQALLVRKSDYVAGTRSGVRLRI